MSAATIELASARARRRSADALAGPNGLELAVQIAHDLRSPLSAILVLAESLASGGAGPVTEAQAKQLSIIYSAALGLCSSASDVVEMARSGEQLTDTHGASFSIQEVFDDVRRMVMPIVSQTTLELRTTAPARSRRIGNARALSRVILNLTTNALKYTDAGSIEISARECEASPRRVKFSVRDTGCGIDLEEMHTLFEPFHERGNAGRHHFSSAGLGLSICRRLVEAMGSSLLVETRARQGTCFHFELDLPVAQRDHAAPARNTRPVRHRSGT